MEGSKMMTMSLSLADKAYQELRKRIIYGEYLPGEVLSENVLSEELEMSRTPIRDALGRLTSDGFVRTLKNRGVLVKEICYKELFDIQVMNQWMHLYTFDLASNGVISFDIDTLKFHLNKQRKAKEDGDYISYIKHAIYFGRSMIESTNNQTMLEIFDTYRTKTMRMAIVNWKLYPDELHYAANDLNHAIFNVIQNKEYNQVKQIYEKYQVLSRERLMRAGQL